MKNEIIEIIRTTLSLGEKSINENTEIEKIIESSIDAIELIAVLSNKYKIRIEPKDLNRIKKVRDIVSYIEKNKGKSKTKIKLEGF
ncbi:MAG: acyl carrier protein [Nanoarchaeota archaeon]